MNTPSPPLLPLMEHFDRSHSLEKPTPEICWRLDAGSLQGDGGEKSPPKNLSTQRSPGPGVVLGGQLQPREAGGGFGLVVAEPWIRPDPPHPSGTAPRAGPHLVALDLLPDLLGGHLRAAVLQALGVFQPHEGALEDEEGSEPRSQSPRTLPLPSHRPVPGLGPAPGAPHGAVTSSESMAKGRRGRTHRHPGSPPPPLRPPPPLSLSFPQPGSASGAVPVSLGPARDGFKPWWWPRLAGSVQR